MRTTLLAACLALLGAAVARAAADDLESGFADPPHAAKPWAYWWWLDGFATKEGITKDLEEMRRQGISGVLLFDAGEGKGSPVGPVFMSEPWRDLFKHAIGEADRLGIEVGVNLCSGWNAGGTWVTPEHAAKKLVFSEVRVRGPADATRILTAPPVNQGYYRDIAVVAFRNLRAPDAPRAEIKHWELKSANRDLRGLPLGAQDDDLPSAPGEEDCRAADVEDLTARMDGEGRFSWEAPEGDWTILRFGTTLLGSRTKCVSPGAQGYEIDFLSAEAMDLHFGETAEKLFADVRPLVGKTLTHVHVDSYESGEPTWTPRMRDEFRARRGYDLLPYLPVLAKRIVDSREISNRFLRDWRRTIGDLFAEKYYGRLRELARRHGVGTHPESGGPFWPHIDALQSLALNDIPMGEFWKRRTEPDGPVWWTDDYPICDTVKQAASAAHIYGKPICQAEAFTSMGPNWEEDPFMLKDIGDRAFCAGLTRNVLCFYVHQPRLDIVPGFQWEAAGTHFDRNVTWWGKIDAWLTYLSRCQFLLRQGRFVADLCYYYGEDVPSYVPAKTHMRPALPKGYDCDTMNAEVLLHRLDVKDGRLVLPDGMSYRYLVLPGRRTASPAVMRKIAALVEGGATVIGARPERAPGLTDFPRCDEEVKRLADDGWGRPLRGRVISTPILGGILAADGLLPDFESGSAPDAEIDFIHRSAEGLDIYFVSNQRNRPESAACIFRVRGKQPEIWDPVTGERWDAREFGDAGGRTVVPLEFAPRQSFFIVFRRPADATRVRGRNHPRVTAIATIDSSWSVRFDPKWGGPESAVFEKLEDWTKRPEDGIRYYSGAAVYETIFDLPEEMRAPARRLFLDLGEVRNVADVTLNGRRLGVVWTAPWRVDITAAAKPADNRLAIEVVNLWPNRLIGDAHLPPEKRWTVTNVKKFTKDSPLMPSGLLGPVTLQAAE